MKNLNIIGLITNNFSLNELINLRESVKSGNLLKIIKNTEERYKNVKLISFVRSGEKVSGESRVISLWYENARYDDIFKLETPIACMKKYDDRTLIFSDGKKAALYLYDLRHNKVVKAFGYSQSEANNLGVNDNTDPNHELNDGDDVMANGKIDNIIVIDSDTVCGIDLVRHNIIFWSISKGITVNIIHDPDLRIYCSGGSKLYLAVNGGIRCYNLNDYSKEHKLINNNSYAINGLWYISDNYLLFHSTGETTLFEFKEDYAKVKKITQSMPILNPLIIGQEEFIFALKFTSVIHAYNFKKVMETKPFAEEIDDLNDPEAKDINLTSYAKMGEYDLITSNNSYEIRIWDIPTRKCKRVLASPLYCYDIITASNSFITIMGEYGHLHIWKLNELDLHSALNT
jgi:WD40 repeat protein